MSIIADAKLKCAVEESYNQRLEAVKEIITDIVKIFTKAYKVEHTRKNGRDFYEIIGIEGMDNPTPIPAINAITDLQTFSL